jgi:hypothetical protein
MAAMQWLADGLSDSLILSFTMGASINCAAVSRFVSENYAPKITRSLNMALFPLAFLLIFGLISFPFDWFR